MKLRDYQTVVNPASGRKVKLSSPIGKVIHFFNTGQTAYVPKVKHVRRSRKRAARVSLP